METLGDLLEVIEKEAREKGFNGDIKSLKIDFIDVTSGDDWDVTVDDESKRVSVF